MINTTNPIATYIYRHMYNRRFRYWLSRHRRQRAFFAILTFVNHIRVVCRNLLTVTHVQNLLTDRHLPTRRDLLAHPHADASVVASATCFVLFVARKPWLCPLACSPPSQRATQKLSLPHHRPPNNHSIRWARKSFPKMQKSATRTLPVRAPTLAR